MSGVLAQLSRESIEFQSRSIFKQLLDHPKYKQARRLAIYLSTDREVDTIELVKHSLEVEGKKCYVPYVRPTGRTGAGPRMQMVELSSMSQYEKLKLNRYGIKEPDEHLARRQQSLNANDVEDLLILVPGVAFSSDGRRLGHGKGYYDEYLNYLASNGERTPFAIGLALREQIVADPMAIEGLDYKLDEVLTG